ncbi:DUF2182 domain-containing protein [Conexibacter sp. JD483]|uniref:DUF2182 domain-containing protein n=1 Tax=unclassified Conexibacter TaxID=2627773 RepID=UPI00271D4AD4|nr:MULTISPECIES: DUF2182 domain-containing protein [unclassified Conexibacter]MDO8185476.1 DUF2182 domain-containing protein [Conexibacter sp. CPCC 205706]MDO8197337.1 DUF2182 domain-containing protein [Conexibacter sp. CPCC 205762]MDR9371101.1 DUF2182 domain-containing protein [Conexibacter sp. JD483]
MAARLLGPRALTAALALLALVALLSWGLSPYARFLHHEYEPASAGGQAVAIAFFLTGWLLMCTAMMLPTTTALVHAFDRMTQARPLAERARLRLLLIAGFLAVWVVVGYLFRALDVLIHATVDAVGWLGAHAGIVAAVTLAIAGAYQFAPIKQRCLTACRSPRALLTGGWSGARPVADALRIGVAYGRSCVGCCWALMLVMFGLGMSNPALMLGLAALMTAERFAPTRLRLGEAAGMVLLGASAIVAVGTLT